MTYIFNKIFHKDHSSGSNSMSRFRAVIIGKTGCGKTTILEKFCGGKIADSPSETRGMHDINKELVSLENPRFVAYDSRGFEAGSDTELRKVLKFLKQRDKMSIPNQIHIIWYCIQADCRPIQASETKFFSEPHGSAPVVVVVTKFDVLVTDNLPDLDEGDDTPEREAEARALAIKKSEASFQEFYREPLLKMRYRPDYIIKLSNAHKPDPSNLLLTDLVDATMLCLTRADTDLLMSFATSQRLKQLVPEDFPLDCRFRLFYASKIADHILLVDTHVQAFVTHGQQHGGLRETFYQPVDTYLSQFDSTIEFWSKVVAHVHQYSPVPFTNSRGDGYERNKKSPLLQRLLMIGPHFAMVSSWVH
ncbi:hypothetical protein SISNIDRAFT_317187 [Sistotremastrum niveocremeum HHB9708]|uniref:G domain-containing protein n=1 Tax=Sistotremastrum niveocremeum HHB9708 TaxID=1314777 RepID=A0A164Y1J9_9AGAM|nr:hypothetical protein SISNIDRAFT_317187 [Sistotremastrum niveocremeum HHB9708]